MKLTNFSKIILVVVIMAILFFVLRKYLPFGKNTNGVNTEMTTTGNTTDNTSAGNNSTSTTAQTTKTFDYTAPEPIGGKLKGVVELGAAGFNSFIVNIDKSKRWKLEKAEWGNSLVYDKMANNTDIRDGLKRYIGNIFDYGVSSKDIHFVVSSGALKVEATQKIINELKKMGYVVNTVTPEQEAKLALKCVLPTDFYSNSFVLDIGSGNTKLSWIDTNGAPKGIDTYGAKYYVDKVADETVAADVVAKSKNVPADRTKTCFILGGVPHDLADQVRIGEERYTVLKNPDFYKANGEKLKCGLNIYKNIKNTTNCDQFVFDWNSNFTIGFLLGLN